ncbi:MAG: FAD-binding oxidoreductase [Acidobacteria bacterium]|nr:FAD-binding oxidoreductase [Acidobacteriota bacterium]
MIPERAGAVVCGAGIGGLSVAWHLAARRGLENVLIVDERPPLTLTSDKSTECYRNWWPDEPMIALTNRTAELLDEIAAATDDAIALNRNGYLYLTATATGAGAMERAARETAAAGAGELRVHRGSSDDPPWVAPRWNRPETGVGGADLFLDAGALRACFPWYRGDAVAGLHARRCGWLSAQQLGMVWLEQAREAGARLVEGRATSVEVRDGRVVAVTLEAAGDSRRIETDCFVDAAGPFAADVARWVGVELPLRHELHLKVFFDDELGILPREAPLVIWNDPVRVDWSEEEREGLAEDPATASLLGEIPAGVHFRPEGGVGSHSAILLWNYHVGSQPRPTYPFEIDPLHLAVVIRGVARIVPEFGVYAERGRRPYVDGGYYSKTPENRPLIGPLSPEVEGAWILGALSGFGIMAAPAAGELLAAQISGEPIPDWARAFLPSRYDDPAYVASLASLASGQL